MFVNDRLLASINRAYSKKKKILISSSERNERLPAETRRETLSIEYKKHDCP